jgi:hypothetical protein
MKDSGQAVRKGFYDALNDAIAIPGDPINKVPIVDEKLDLNITEHDLYMLIGGQASNAANTKQTWADEIDINITIVNRRKATNSKTTIESIADDVLGILFPTRITEGITISPPFCLSFVRKVSDSYQFDRTADGWEIKKSIIFKTRITQT